jgi:hypothetical protein
MTGDQPTSDHPADDHPVDELERAYRRLLFAYPRGFRRERGEEILSTLLDAAPPGKRQPTGAEYRNLIGHGLWRRFGPTPGSNTLLGITAFALVVGAIAVSVATYIGWRSTAAPLPDNHRALAEAAELAPGLTPREPVRFDALFDYDVRVGEFGPIYGLTHGEEDYMPGYVQVTYERPRDTVRDDLGALCRRLGGTGWHVNPTSRKWNCQGRRGDLQLTAEVNSDMFSWVVDNHQLTNIPIDVRFTRAEPSWMKPLGLLAGSVGFVVSWLIAARLTWRARNIPVYIRSSVAIMGITGLVLALPAAVMTWSFLVLDDLPGAPLIGPMFSPVFLSDLSGPDLAQADPYWAAYLTFPIPLLNDPGLIALLGGGVLLLGRLTIPRRLLNRIAGRQTASGRS